MHAFKKYIILLLIFLFAVSTDVISQNSYGWERILNSIYGINSFYSVKLKNDVNKYWGVKLISDYTYRFYSNSTWHTAYNGALNSFHWVITPGGNYIEGWNHPNIFAISSCDTNFFLLNFDERIPFYGGQIRTYYSWDFGANKIIINSLDGIILSGLAIDPNNDSINYCASNQIIYKSTSRGANWFVTDSIESFSGLLTINSNNTNYIYGMDDSLFISSDKGYNFSYAAGIKLIQMIFLDDTTIIARGGKKIYSSHDAGYSWKKLDSLSDNINFLENDPDNNAIIYAGTNSGLFKSTNSGVNFYLFNNSFTPSKKVNGIVKEKNAPYVYVVTEEAAYKCWDNYVIGINQLLENIPGSYFLYQNFPNPFNPITKIKYDLQLAAHVVLKVFDILGNEVSTLVSQKEDPGNYSVSFDAANFSNGIYFYSLFIDGKNAGTKKMLLIK